MRSGHLLANGLNIHMNMNGSKCNWSKLSWLLLFIGGLNWGLVGLSDLVSDGGWNLVNWIFGSWPMVESIVYLLVGVAAILSLWHCKCSTCNPGGQMGGQQ